MASVVYFRGNIDEARAVARGLVSLLVGRASDPQNIGRGVFLSLGVAALTDIQADFLRKSLGGTGEDGVQWPPLSKTYRSQGRSSGGAPRAAMLRGSGALFNSISPGQLSGAGPTASYTKPGGEGGDQQIFETTPRGVIVGTSVPYADAVNQRRPFIPATVPTIWTERWAAATSQALLAGAKLAYEAWRR